MVFCFGVCFGLLIVWVVFVYEGFGWWVYLVFGCICLLVCLCVVCDLFVFVVCWWYFVGLICLEFWSVGLFCVGWMLVYGLLFWFEFGGVFCWVFVGCCRLLDWWWVL